jgi:hypothetical protein
MAKELVMAQMETYRQGPEVMRQALRNTRSVISLHIFMAKQSPSHIVYAVKRSSQTGEKGKGGFWTKISAAWKHKDGKGFDIVLELIPVSEPRLVLREREEGDKHRG